MGKHQLGEIDRKICDQDTDRGGGNANFFGHRLDKHGAKYIYEELLQNIIRKSR